MEHKFPYKWKLADGYPAPGIEYHGKTAFGTFVCGGGSTMGYKLAGFHHLGGVEIDPEIAMVYQTNHDPKYFYVEDIRTFNTRANIPDELFNLDLLDGSPPCSSFSMAGRREKRWTQNKAFAEGAKAQRLDDLVFEYIKTIQMLKPKVAILENVKGLISGNAKAYARKIHRDFVNAGYDVQVFLLNSASMGVPQKRERVFFIGRQSKLKWPGLKLEFNEPPIPFAMAYQRNAPIETWHSLKPSEMVRWKLKKYGDKSLADCDFRMRGKRSFFNQRFLYQNEVMPTITATTLGQCCLFDEPRKPNCMENIICGTFPHDYDFQQGHCGYMIGMSVPPIMVAQISHQIWLQWLSQE